jgi:assimilatory nitrate reductase catalytic subunit
MAWLPAGNAIVVREAVALLGRNFSFFSSVPFGNEGRDEASSGRVGVLLRLAHEHAPAPDLLDTLEHWLGIKVDGKGEGLLRYDDAAQGQRRVMRVSQGATEQHLQAFLMAGDVQAQAWVRPLLQEDQAVGALGTLLLHPGRKAPGQVASRGKQVCTCFNVTEPQIQSCLMRCTGSDEQRLAQLQGELRCGTNCGSCVPALRKLVREVPIGAAIEAPHQSPQQQAKEPV